MMQGTSQGLQPTLHSRAIKLLARREYSRAELAKKLADQVASATAKEIDHTLDQLEHSGLLSDARAAAAFIRSHAARFGLARLNHDLRKKGINQTLIESCLTQDDMDDEPTRAATIWHRKYAEKPRTQQEWARQARFLRGRGFSSDVIHTLLNTREVKHD